MPLPATSMPLSSRSSPQQSWTSTSESLHESSVRCLGTSDCPVGWSVSSSRQVNATKNSDYTTVFEPGRSAVPRTIMSPVFTAGVNTDLVSVRCAITKPSILLRLHSPHVACIIFETFDLTHLLQRAPSMSKFDFTRSFVLQVPGLSLCKHLQFPTS